MLTRLIGSLLSVLLCTAPCLALQESGTLENKSDYPRETKQGIAALQAWYVQDTGLYQGIGWWNSANATTVVIDYMRASHNRDYLPNLANTLQKAQTRYSGFLNTYYDDEGWWALAWIDAYDLTKDERYLTMAASIFADMTKGWDDTCNGGIWWSKDKTYKNAIANELFLSVAAHLAARAHASEERVQYTAWAKKEWQWFANTGMINADHLVNDGLVTASCKNNLKTTWSYNQGVIVGGLVELNRIAPDPTLHKTAGFIAQATLLHLTDADGVLHDTCEPKCGEDGIQFKGIFTRNLEALQNTYPDPRYQVFFDVNAQSILMKSQGPNHQFGQVWSGPFDAGDAGSQSSALDTLVAASGSNHRSHAVPKK
ncbi:glycoside hydrolase family 76 protein [Granulicella arctica]|uniref:glycoside hydrolase family 76 protein n=1 Tax=Granulicella arctica TaxID=940613 RepID=UPI0021DF8023|nr:glycoside hydrolase family 76 protein [Granulicella arctica]